MVVVAGIREGDRRLDVHVSTIGSNQGQFIRRDGIRNSKNALVAFAETGEGEADAGVAAGAFYDDPTGLKQAFAFGFLHCFVCLFDWFLPLLYSLVSSFLLNYAILF